MAYLNMKYLLTIILTIVFSCNLFAQKKILVEKIGTNRKYYFNIGDDLKLKVKPYDTIIRGELMDISDSKILITGLRMNDVMIKDIGSVYKHYAFPKKFAINTAIFGGAIFTIIVVNHLINNETVFTSDLFIISGSFIAASLISLSFSQKQCKIGSRWKIKVLDFSIPK